MRRFRAVSLWSFRGRPASGFMLIELLLVVIVIALLTGYYMKDGSSEKAAASNYQMSMDRSKATACLASRSALRTQIMSYSMQHTNEPLTTEALQKAGINLNVCPSGGTITVSQDGTLQCSIHNQ